MMARPHSLLLRLVALILLLLALPLGAVSLGTALELLPLPYPLWQVQQRLPLVFRLHMASAGLALLAVSVAIASHGRSLHRLVGRIAAALVLLGGATALPVALASESHWFARAGFLAQAALWMALVLDAVRAIRQGDRIRHMWLMLSVAAIASGALWLRLATWAAVRSGAPFDVAYALAAWLSWMLPLAAVALLARVGKGRPPPKPPGLGRTFPGGTGPGRPAAADQADQRTGWPMPSRLPSLSRNQETGH